MLVRHERIDRNAAVVRPYILYNLSNPFSDFKTFSSTMPKKKKKYILYIHIYPPCTYII